MNRKGRVGSMAPTSLPAVSYLSFQGVSCQRQQRDQVSRTSSNSLRVEHKLFLHPEKKPQQPHISPEAGDFPSGPEGTVGNAPLPTAQQGRTSPPASLAGICCTRGWQIPVLTFTDGDCFPQICWFILTGFHLLILPPKPSGPVSRYL